MGIKIKNSSIIIDTTINELLKRLGLIPGHEDNFLPEMKVNGQNIIFSFQKIKTKDQLRKEKLVDKKMLKKAEQILLRDFLLDFKKNQETFAGKGSATRFLHSIELMYSWPQVDKETDFKTVKLSQLLAEFKKNDFYKVRSLGPKTITFFEEYLKTKGFRLLP